MEWLPHDDHLTLAVANWKEVSFIIFNYYVNEKLGYRRGTERRAMLLN